MMTAPHITSRLPAPVGRFFALFPLVKYPALGPNESVTRDAEGTPTLWIRPPLQDEDREDVLSADVECLKWQAYLALRAHAQQHAKRFNVRWDVHPAGAIGGHLPNLYLPEGELLPSHDIPEWADKHIGGASEDGLEGYVDVAARDESRAWVSLLEGNVHAALLAATPTPITLESLLTATATSPAEELNQVLPTPAAPLFGFSSLLYTPHTRIPLASIEQRYREAIGALSERLGTDTWFLGSSAPTFLDALVFAYLHRLLSAPDSVRIEVTRRVNLVAWERKVATLVRPAFRRHVSS